MSYPKRTLKYRPTKGAAADTPTVELAEDFWGGAIQNVIFRNGFARRLPGSRTVYDGLWPDPLVHLLNARIDTTNYWLGFSTNTIFAIETSNSDDVTPAAGLEDVTDPWRYSSTLLNGVPVFTNGLDTPHYWAGDVGTPFVELPDWPAGSTCKSIAAFKYHLFALDLDESGGHFEGKVMWSDATEPGSVPDSWTPAGDNEAGSTELSDTAGPALVAVPLRGSLLVYKRSSLYAADYLEGQTFVFRTLFTSSGALTRHAVADINGQHLVVTDGDIILTDGTNRRSIGEARYREFLFANIDSTYYENLFVVYNRAKGEALIAFPETGNQFCTKALVYDVARDSFGERDLDETTAGAVGVVNDDATSEIIDDQDIIIDDDTRFLNQQNFSLATETLLLADNDEHAHMQDTDDAVTLAAKIGRYDLVMGDAARVKFVRRVHVRAGPNAGTLFVRVGARMTPDSNIAWSDEFTLAEGEQIVNAFAQGRYISVEIRSAGTEVWSVSGVDIEYEARGYH